MTDQGIIASVIFILVYALIATEWVHRTIIALLGAMAMILLRIVSQHDAFAGVDLNVILLLTGMMIIAHILATTGVFEWVAIRAVKIAKADPFRMLVALSLLTAVASAFLDNVTTVVLIAPVTFYVASALKIRPTAFLIAEIFAANIGGTATLIGDPPNILIGSAAGLSFGAFLDNLAPIVIVILAVFIGIARLTLVQGLVVDKDLREQLLETDESEFITDRPLLRKSLIVLSVTIIGFLFHGGLGYEPATIAVAGAAVLLVWSNFDINDALQHVEWATLLFFVGLFMMVEGVIETGVIDSLARAALGVTGGDPGVTAMLLLWMSAILSGVVDNIPYTATLIPVVQEMGKVMPIEPLWWSLALGACLGGNLTLIGAAANVIVANLADRSGNPISFVEFFKHGALTTFISMVIASVYVWIRYIVFAPPIF